MRRVESHSVPDKLSQQHIPTSMESILMAISPLTLEKVADRVMEVTPVVVENHLLEEKKLNWLNEGILCSRSRDHDCPINKRKC
ncbi:hypothetical protein TNCT_675671 [Trichonephila clavata]|uniref:Uncharacterized protein n=1 Tax=Trichonephila clavata TaxID=2740835 RepID=A0A8X6LDV9_TRICU|nr:hypothetical protein TNCT_675671 [Trichonephila clavata]